MATYEDDEGEEIVTHPPVGLQITPPNVVATPHYKAEVINTRYTPIENILTYMEGTPVYLDFYQQIVTSQHELRAPQVTTETGTTVTQEYNFIKKLELRQQSDFDFSYDSSNGSVSITGELTFYPRVVPNKYDILVGDIRTGKGGIFIITEVIPLMYTVQRAHRVRFELLAEYGSGGWLAYLDAHTIKRYRFNTDYLRLGKDPMMTESAFDVMRRLIQCRRDILYRFMGKFFDRHISAPILFHSDRKVYDPMLTKAIRELTDQEEHPQLAELFQRSMDELPGFSIPTLWDCLVECRAEMFYAISGKMNVLGRNVFGRYSPMHGIRYSNMDYIVYPAEHTEPIAGTDLYEVTDTPLQIAINHFVFDDINVEADTPLDLDAEPTVDIPEEILNDSPLYAQQFPDLTSDPYYVLSGAYYNEQFHHQSLIEREVVKMLKGEKLDLEGIVNMCDDLKRRPTIEQFYYTVVLLALTRYAINQSY